MKSLFDCSIELYNIVFLFLFVDNAGPSSAIVQSITGH